MDKAVKDFMNWLEAQYLRGKGHSDEDIEIFAKRHNVDVMEFKQALIKPIMDFCVTFGLTIA